MHFMKLTRPIIFSFIVLLLVTSCTCNKQQHSMEPTGLIVKESNLDFETTYATIRDRIENNPNLKIILELDHRKNAASKDLELRPTKLLVFGNPNLGTPLMQVSPTLAIDLPQKIIVYQEKDQVYIAYNDPAYLKQRHDIEGKDEVLAKITGALDKITLL